MATLSRDEKNRFNFIRWRRATDALVSDVPITELADVPLFLEPPTNLTARIVSGDTSLFWQEPVAKRDGYIVERSPLGDVWTQVGADLPVGTTTFVDVGNTDFFYRVRAFSDALGYRRLFSTPTNAVSGFTEIIFEYAPVLDSGAYKVSAANQPLTIQPSGDISVDIIVDFGDGITREALNTTTTFSVTSADMPILPNGDTRNMTITVNEAGTSTPAFSEITELSIEWMKINPVVAKPMPNSLFALSNLTKLELTQVRNVIVGGQGYTEIPTNLAQLDKLTTIILVLCIAPANAGMLDPVLFDLPLSRLTYTHAELGANAAANGYEAANLDRLPELNNTLTYLRLEACELEGLPANYNQLTQLTTQWIGFKQGTTVPSVMNTTSPLTTAFLDVRAAGSYTGFDMTLYGEIATFRNGANQTAPTEIPTGLNPTSSYVASLSYSTQVRSDEFIDNLYTFAVANGSISGVGNFNGFALDYRLNTTPSGVYQAPAEFVKNVSNGTPANQQEKIYALIENYNITFLF
ncbi:fibronectin type III domain-containing protein [bacterium]|nr:fibronectin type III domain-containing protein [bacterium]